MWKAMLRGFSTKFPEELATGQSALDEYLRSLDAQLWGNVKVRSVDLLEIRDHLVESHAALVRQGHVPSQAAEMAVQQAGSFEELVNNQHQTLLKRFRKVFRLWPYFGLNHAVMALVFERNRSNIFETDMNWYSLMLNITLVCILTIKGFALIAWYWSFQIPSTLLGARAPKGSSFEMGRRFPIWWMVLICLPFVGDVIHVVFTSKPFYNSWPFLYMTAAPAWLGLYLAKGQSYGANDRGLWIRHWPFPAREIRWEDIKRFGPVDVEWPNRNVRPDPRRYYVDFRGTPSFLRWFRRWYLSPAVATNVDRLFLMLEEKTGRPPVPFSQAKLYQPSRSERLKV